MALCQLAAVLLFVVVSPVITMHCYPMALASSTYQATRLFPALLEGAKWIARTAAQQPWDSVAELHQPDFWKEMDEVLTTNLRAPFSLCVQQLDPERAMMIFSDAKGSPEPTWAITSGDIVQSGRFTEWQAAHIFFHEFRVCVL